ncbi:hypothetical protein MKX03_019437, partial [Papaver bracteatum]
FLLLLLLILLLLLLIILMMMSCLPLCCLHNYEILMQGFYGEHTLWLENRLGCSTVLCLKAYAELLEEDDPKIPAWFFFSYKDVVNVGSTAPLLYLFMDCLYAHS